MSVHAITCTQARYGSCYPACACPCHRGAVIPEVTRDTGTAKPATGPAMADVEQLPSGDFAVRCRIHGLLRERYGSHIAAGLAAAAHLLFAFHGRGAR